MPAPSGDGKADYVCVRYFPFAGFVDRLLCKPDNFCSPKLLDVFNICTFSKNDFQNWGKIQNFSKKFADRLITPVCDMSLWMQPLLCCNMSDTNFWRKRRTRAPGTSALAEIFLPHSLLYYAVSVLYIQPNFKACYCAFCAISMSTLTLWTAWSGLRPRFTHRSTCRVRSWPICTVSFSS